MLCARSFFCSCPSLRSTPKISFLTAPGPVPCCVLCFLFSAVRQLSLPHILSLSWPSQKQRVTSQCINTHSHCYCILHASIRTQGTVSVVSPYICHLSADTAGYRYGPIAVIFARNSVSFVVIALKRKTTQLRLADRFILSGVIIFICMRAPIDFFFGLAFSVSI